MRINERRIMFRNIKLAIQHKFLPLLDPNLFGVTMIFILAKDINDESYMYPIHPVGRFQ